MECACAWERLESVLRRRRDRRRAATSQYVPLINKIGLVPHQYDDDVATALSAHLLHPARSVEEGGAVCERKIQIRRHSAKPREPAPPALSPSKPGQWARAPVVCRFTRAGGLRWGGLLTRHVVHHDGYGGVADIAGDEAAEALLAGGVPARAGHSAVQL